MSAMGAMSVTVTSVTNGYWGDERNCYKWDQSVAFDPTRTWRAACRFVRVVSLQRMSQDDLAYEAEVSRSYLSQLEKGAFHASLKTVGKLALALEVEPAELLKLPIRRAKPSR